MKPQNRFNRFNKSRVLESVDVSSLDELEGNPLIVPRENHSISRKDIDPDAIKVMQRLTRHGYRAFLVGGGVRDLLLGRKPKDFDIGTDARPESVRALFRNSRIIGRRFRINQVYFSQNKIFEVSTFRASGADDTADPVLLKNDNTYGNPESDALRRDLTINGLFYDISSFSLIDYVGGLKDLKDGIIRIIGDPATRFKEDPVRMIRAVRHAARTGFTIESETYSAICHCRELIKNAAPARVFEETCRELRGGSSANSLALLRETGLLKLLIPALDHALDEGQEDACSLLERTLGRIDQAVSHSVDIPLSVLYAAVFLGNLPREVLKQVEEKYSDCLPLGLSVWSPYVDVSSYGDLLEATAEENRPIAVERRGVNYSRRTREKIARSELNRLAEVVNPFFHAMSVPRKEREDLPGILWTRFLLYCGFKEFSEPEELQKSKYFSRALLLLRLTADDELGRRALEFWDRQDSSIGGAADDREIDNRGSRTRRRRPRRRHRRAADGNRLT